MGRDGSGPEFGEGTAGRLSKRREMGGGAGGREKSPMKGKGAGGKYPLRWGGRGKGGPFGRAWRRRVERGRGGRWGFRKTVRRLCERMARVSEGGRRLRFFCEDGRCGYEGLQRLFRWGRDYVVVASLRPIPTKKRVRANSDGGQVLTQVQRDGAREPMWIPVADAAEKRMRVRAGGRPTGGWLRRGAISRKACCAASGGSTGRAAGR